MNANFFSYKISKKQHFITTFLSNVKVFEITFSARNGEINQKVKKKRKMDEVRKEERK